MNDTNGIVDRQVDSMLKLLRRYESTEIEKILDRAYAVADERVRAARHEARLRVREAIRKLRAGVDERLIHVRAVRRAEERRRELEKAGLVLAEARGRLRHAIAARWHEPDTRATWSLSMLERAGEVLPPGRWTVRHAPGWPPEEREAFAARATELAGEAPELSEDPDISAGLDIGLAGAVLDGTLEGLLARGPEIEARLLAAYYAALAESDDAAGGSQ